MVRKGYTVITMDIYPEQHKMVKMLAIEKKCSMSEIVRFSLDRYLNEEIENYKPIFTEIQTFKQTYKTTRPKKVGGDKDGL